MAKTMPSRSQRWAEMGALVPDDVLNLFAVVAPHGQVAAQLRERFAGFATHLEFSIPIAGAGDVARLAGIVRDLKA